MGARSIHHLDFLGFRGCQPGALLAQLFKRPFPFEGHQALLKYPSSLGGVAEELDVVLACALFLTWFLKRNVGVRESELTEH